MSLPSKTVTTPGLSIAFNDTSDWGSGFIGGVTITNTSSSPISNWTIGFTLANAITNIWNARMVSQTGNGYVISAMPYDQTIAPGQSVSFGFQANGGNPVPPTSYVFNGHTITAGGTTTPQPTVSIANASVAETAGKTTVEDFTVSLSAASSSPVTVAYTTANGSAKSGTNYTATSGTLTFAPGTTSETIAVPTMASGTGTVAYNVQLSSPSGAKIGSGTGTGTIINPLPILSIGNASVTENGSGSVSETFTVTLSAASSTAVTVAYTTANGTALAGTDYTATSGTLTFKPGSTKASVTVETKPGTAGTKTFSLLLSKPSNATIAGGTGTGTIIDPATITGSQPTISVGNVSVTETTTTTASGSTLLPSGYLSTSGNQIVSANGTPVKIAAINWYGFETNSYAPQGLWAQNYETMMNQMKSLGFNAIRLPFSLQLFDSTSVPSGINYNLNPDLQGLDGLQIMDKIVSYAGQIGLKIILDDHRSAAGSGPNADGLWYDSGYTAQDWVKTWTMLAQHYANNPTIIGADLLDEPHGAATWGDGSATDWAAAATQAGDAIQAVNPNWLVMVEGIQTYNGQSTWWGGNLMGVASHPITLTDPNKLVYSPHDYPSSVYDQSWFNAANYPNNLPSVWTQNWGYIYQQGIAPVFLGEFGSTLQSTSDQQWIHELVSYINHPGGVGGAQGISWAYWDWNPTSGDTGGILKNDWTTVDYTKMNAITPALYHAGATATTVSPATVDFLMKLSAPSSTPVTVHFQTEDGTAKAGIDYVAESGTVTFAPGTTTAIVSADLLGNATAASSLNFFLALSSPVGATLPNATATATLIPPAANTGTSGGTTPTNTSTSGSGGTVTSGGGTTNTGTGSGSGTASVLVTPTVTQSWAGGFLENVTLVNNGSQALSSWEVEVLTPSTITNLWNATTLSHASGSYLLGNASYNGSLAPGASISFGFQATGASSGPLSAVFVHS
jgi:chitinase